MKMVYTRWYMRFEETVMELLWIEGSEYIDRAGSDTRALGRRRVDMWI